MTDISVEFLDELNRYQWGRFHAEQPYEHTTRRIAIVGCTGTGKKTLVNSLWGWPALSADTPSGAVQKLGLFTLITPPDDHEDDADVMFHLESADLIVYLIDGAANVAEFDTRWIARLRALPPALLIVQTKVDQMEQPPTPDDLAALQDRFARPVIALDITDQRAVHDVFLATVLKLCPTMAVPLAAEITGLRWKVVRQIIRESALTSGLASLENGPTVDLNALLDAQRRLVKQIARIYGYNEQDDDSRMNLLAMAQHIAAHIASEQLDRLGPQGRRLVTTLLSLSGTWALGHQTHARYNGNIVPRRIASWFGRNGRHDHAETSGR